MLIHYWYCYAASRTICCIDGFKFVMCLYIKIRDSFRTMSHIFEKHTKSFVMRSTPRGRRMHKQYQLIRDKLRVDEKSPIYRPSISCSSAKHHHFLCVVTITTSATDIFRFKTHWCCSTPTLSFKMDNH